jgi:hypothetical protein
MTWAIPHQTIKLFVGLPLGIDSLARVANGPSKRRSGALPSMRGVAEPAQQCDQVPQSGEVTPSLGRLTPPTSIEIGVPECSACNAPLHLIRGAQLQYPSFVASGGCKSRRSLAGIVPKQLHGSRNVAFLEIRPRQGPGPGRECRTARAKGKTLGRPRIAVAAARIGRLRSHGRTILEIAGELGYSRSLVHKTLAIGESRGVAIAAY